MIRKIITSGLMAVLLVLNVTTSAFALSSNEVDTAGAEGETQVTFEVVEGSTDSVLIATVPLEIPIVMDTTGSITISSNLNIDNHTEDKGIKVSNIGVHLKNEWQAKGYDEDYSAFENDTKFIGMKMRGDKLLADGTFHITEGNWNIAKKSKLPLNMGVKIPKQTVIHKDDIATLSFRIDWSGDNGDTGSNPDEGIEKPTDPTEPTDKFTVQFISDDNTIINGDKQLEVSKGQQVSLPEAQPINIAYEFDKWVDTETNTEISNSTIEVEKDTVLKAVSNQRVANPSDWFTVDSSGNLTGFTSAYNNLSDAPTDIVVPKQVGGTLVTGIGDNAFSGKNAITSIVLHDGIKKIGMNSFKNCLSLSEILLPSGLESIGLNAFMGTGLTKVDIPSRVQSIHTSAFADNAKLESVTLHEGLKGLGNRVFANCVKITQLDIPSSVTAIGVGAFDNTAIDKLDLSFKEIYRIANSPWGLSDDKITWGTAPDWDTDPIRAGDVAGRNLSWNSMTQEIAVKTVGFTGKTTNDVTITGVINIPTSIDGIKVTGISEKKNNDNNTSYPIGGFYGCVNLTKINIPNTIERIGFNAFENTSSTSGMGPGKLFITVDNAQDIISGAPWRYADKGGASGGVIKPWTQPIEYLR